MSSQEVNEQTSNNELKYILVPEFLDKKKIMEFFLVLVMFSILIIIYICVSNYDITYVPNFSMFIDFITDNSSSQDKFKKYIQELVYTNNESFQSNRLDIKNNKSTPTINDKIRFYINKFVTNFFHVKGNTVHVKFKNL